MRLRVLGCSGGSAPGHLLSGYLLDERLAVDAGSLTTGLDLAAQQQIEAVLLTHAHLDHCWSFPLFLVNRLTGGGGPLAMHGSQAALDAVRAHLLNDEVWLAEDRIRVDGRPLCDFRPLADGERREILPGWEVEAVGLVHPVPSQAFFVTRQGSTVIVCGDTGPTDALWARANRARGLRAVVIECSFPDEEEDLAARTGHLVPRTLAEQVGRLAARVPILVTHVKPEFRARVIDEVRALEDARLRILEDGQVIDL